MGRKGEGTDGHDGLKMGGSWEVLDASVSPPHTHTIRWSLLLEVKHEEFGKVEVEEGGLMNEFLHILSEKAAGCQDNNLFFSICPPPSVCLSLVSLTFAHFIQRHSIFPFSLFLFVRVSACVCLL